MNSASILFVVFGCLGQVVSPYDFKVNGHDKNALSLLVETVEAFNKLLDFFQENVKVVNLDGIFGLRIAEGVFERTLNTLEENQQTSNSSQITQKMAALKNKVTSIIFKAIPYLKTTNKTYYEQVGVVVENKWTIVRPLTGKLSDDLVTVSPEDVITKYGSPHQPCMEELFGSAGPTSRPCTVTQKCLNVMTKPEVAYTLTHQALYFMFGQQYGCSAILTAKLREAGIQGGIPHMYDAICSTMYPQMVVLEKIRHKPLEKMDLYLEQAVVCGVLGYKDFFSKPRLRQLLKWQFPSGCYGDPLEHPSEYVDDFSQNLLPKRLLREHSKIRRTMKMLSGGCESHISGISSSLLALYIRWIVLTQDKTMNLEK